MNLYEYAEQYREALTNLESQGFDEEVIKDSLSVLSGELEDKGRAVAAFILNKDADIEALKSHKADIDAKIKALTSRNEWLKNYLRSNMEACGISKIESPLFKISLRKPSKVVQIENEDSLPSEFIKTTTAPKKADIAKALKAGEEVSGARLIDGKAGITIK